jgi:hypothetical protein
VKLTSHLHKAPRIRINRTKPPIPIRLHGVVFRRRTVLPLPLPLPLHSPPFVTTHFHRSSQVWQLLPDPVCLEPNNNNIANIKKCQPAYGRTRSIESQCSVYTHQLRVEQPDLFLQGACYRVYLFLLQGYCATSESDKESMKL